jgi:hypothetical protein
VLSISFSLLVVTWTENFGCKVRFLGLLDFKASHWLKCFSSRPLASTVKRAVYKQTEIRTHGTMPLSAVIVDTLPKTVESPLVLHRIPKTSTLVSRCLSDGGSVRHLGCTQFLNILINNLITLHCRHLHKPLLLHLPTDQSSPADEFHEKERLGSVFVISSQRECAVCVLGLIRE